ncbi:MAG TPA: CBS and ACT domain-containing protein [Anaerolineae bacterium]
MLVGERMTRNPVTISEDANIDDALHLMRERKVRRLPVVDHSSKMVGIVSDKDLLHAAPSPATSLSVYEVHYLLSKLTVKKVMSCPVVTVGVRTPLEEAARIMADNKIGGLPVVEDDKLIGIITETDIFKILLELLGARVPGLRVTLRAPEVKGMLARITSAISTRGGNIISLVTFGEEAGGRQIVIKTSEIDQDALAAALAELGVTIVDVRSD